MAEDVFRNPFNPLDVFQEWWGEPLSEESYKKATAAPTYQQVEFLEFARERSLDNFSIPDLQRGAIRPLLVNDGFHHSGFDDYYAAAATLALYADEVGVEYIFGFHPPHLNELLKYLLDLKPLAETGGIRFFNPHHEIHQDLHYSEDDLDNLGFDLGDSQHNQLREALSRFVSASGRTMRLENAIWIVMSQLAGKSAIPDKLSLLVRSEPENILINAFTSLPDNNPRDKRRYAIAKLIGLRVPLYDLNIQSLAKLRQSESVFDEWRSSVRKALDDIEGLPDGTDRWRDQAREIAAGELIHLEKKIEQVTRISPTLAKAKIGLNGIAFSAAGASAGMTLGGNFKSDFAGAAVAETLHVVGEYWQAVKRRRKLSAIKDLIVNFIRPA
jgi:hypothetical protein